MNEDTKKLIKQNEIIISLLGRIAFTKDQVRRIVTSRKQNPERYIDGYNACNGNHSVSQIARVVNVAPATISTILKDWEEVGIIYEVEKTGGKFYKKLFPLEE